VPCLTVAEECPVPWIPHQVREDTLDLLKNPSVHHSRPLGQMHTGTDQDNHRMQHASPRKTSTTYSAASARFAAAMPEVQAP